MNLLPVLPDSHSGTTITELVELADRVSERIAECIRKNDAALAELSELIALVASSSDQSLANLQECNRLVEPPIRVNGGDLR